MAWTREQLLANLVIKQAKRKTLETAYSAVDVCLNEVASVLEGDYVAHLDLDAFAAEYLAKYTAAVSALQTAANAMGG